jgi:hypothetical protein
MGWNAGEFSHQELTHWPPVTAWTVMVMGFDRHVS